MPPSLLQCEGHRREGKAMVLDRRRVIRSAGVSFTLSPIAHAQSLSDAPAGPDYTDLIKEVLGMFRPMPGVKSLLIWAPKTADQPELKISLDPALRMFVGSAFKAFVLCERLRQLDGPDVGKRLQENLLPLDASVWSPSSPVFDPPHLSGRVPE